MVRHGAMYYLIFGSLLVIFVSIGLLRFSRGRRLGPALLKESGGSRWFALVWLVLGLSKIWDYLRGESLWVASLDAGVFGAVAVFWWIGKNFSIHAEGMVHGMTVVFWDELEGWSWSLGKGRLVVWSRSWWVRAMTGRSVNGMDTGQPKTGELDELLVRFAGAAQRPSGLSEALRQG